ncbi:MAG TPA: site-specific integrase [Pyrinomonadaceae bacterium]|nr:site-specific integrase [Pyrinomonadaceae bacterium]
MEIEQTKKKRGSPRYWKEINGNLYARFQYKTDTGKSKEKYKRITDKRLAKRAVDEMRREFEEHGEDTLTSDKLTFAELSAVYAEQKIIPAAYSNGVKVSGRRSLIPVRSALKTLTQYFGTKPIRTIKSADIERFKQTRLKTPTTYGGQRKIASVNRELELLRTILNYAVQNEWLLRNPFTLTKGIISKAAEVERDRILSAEEESRLLEGCSGRRKHLRPLLVCALDTAMRRGEIFRMRWADVRLDTNEIFIPQTNTKTEEARTVGITRRLRDELENLWDCSPRNLEGLVFGVTNTIKTAFKSLCEDAGVGGFRFHDCRHTATTRMIMAGSSHTEVMKITGHSQLKTFLRYLNIKAETTNKVASALDTYLSETSAVPLVSDRLN